MIALIASIFALGIGPLIYQTFGPLRRTDRIVSGFILSVIIISLFFEVLPHAFASIGYIAVALAVFGFVGPTLIEQLFAKSANHTHLATILLGVLGLIVHASIDGAALYKGGVSRQQESLALAIIVHRLPVGLTIWWLLKPLLGDRYALLTLLAMAIATGSGFILSMQLEPYYNGFAFIALQAFISGSLLHIVFHKPHADGCMHTSQSHHRSDHHIGQKQNFQSSHHNPIQNEKQSQRQKLKLKTKTKTKTALARSMGMVRHNHGNPCYVCKPFVFVISRKYLSST